MHIRYNIDVDTGRPHIEQHGVTLREVADVLARPIENLPGQRNSRIILGRTREGRFLKVIVIPDETGSGIFVVTGYDLVGKPLRAHRRRTKKRGTK